MWRFYPLLFIISLLASRLQAEPVAFVQNRGQWASEVRFRAEIPGGYLYLKDNALHYVFYDGSALSSHHTPTAGQPISDQIPGHAVEVRFEGANTASQIETSHPSPTIRNYLTGKNPTGNVAAFSEVLYHDLYPGIDLRLYAYYQTLKYEFIVRPGADPSVIQLVYLGANQLRIDKEQLIVETSLQAITESRPYSYVSQNGRATEVAAFWQLDAGQSPAGNSRKVGFRFPNGYDKSQTLTIDPELVFSTYSGSYSDNWGMTATYDTDGNLYSGGIVFGPDFPATTGAFRTRFSGVVDVAILKFSPDGSKLLYATFLGGKAAEVPHSLIVNGQGNLVVMGSTSSTDFPVTAGAYQTKTQLGTPASYSFATTTSIEFTNGSDLFVSILSPDGKQLVASTFVGGASKDGVGSRLSTGPNSDGISFRNYGDDLRGEVIVGPDNDVYVASVTESTDFPAPALPVTGTNLADGVVFRLSADLSQLRWSSRIGGSGYDKAHSLKLTSSGTLYVGGVTTSRDLPASADAIKSKPESTTQADGFVARFDNQQLTRLTYLGTAADDIVYLLDVDTDGNPYVFGSTKGKYPVTTGTYQNAGSSQFIHALDANLSSTVFSTVVGSERATPDIAPTAFLINECGNIYLSGWGGAVNARTGYNVSSSTNGLPVTSGAYKRTTNGSNFWVALLERGAKSLLYATFVGSEAVGRGDHVDGGTSRFNKQGVIYHAVCACGGTSFPATAQAWSKTNNSSNCNNLAFKFDVDRLRAGFDTYRGTEKGIVTGCTPLTLTFQNTSTGGKQYQWVIDGQVVSTDTAKTSYVFTKAGQYTVKIRAYNPLTCQRVDSVQQVITVNPANFRVSPDTTICPDAAAMLRASGAIQYVWSPADGLSSTTIANPIARPKQTTTYTVDMTNEYGCTTRRNVTVSSDASFRPDFSVQIGENCSQAAQLTFVNNTKNADQYVWQLGNGDTIRTTIPENYQYEQSGQYAVTLTAYRNGCSLSTTKPINVENLNNIPNVITPNNDGKNDVFNSGLFNAQLVIYNRWGRRVFEASPYQNNWGSNVDNGVYYYLLTTPSGVQCKGWIQVLE
ncbi:gliding motility-associated C-terminal domain-containing protein [Spirosoma sp. RP8]|uniref:Gliding motility-associated C-terminal domain-containing protein n=1 Tax=Spirosoma liriopis TaxID=2937440 RepID=A0ABT0HI37_9BACT|nr:gliding motility-associated C-terminal domain-containing protein [Spirosoma liriopis]MCK8491318.1 gliding motility-associated C-terminal domain-containing protein [Spirosoma liriopis]